MEKEEFEHETMKFNKCLTECVNKSVLLFNEYKESLENKIDLVICLGGDGTLLHVSSLFQVGLLNAYVPSPTTSCIIIAVDRGAVRLYCR